MDFYKATYELNAVTSLVIQPDALKEEVAIDKQGMLLCAIIYAKDLFEAEVMAIKIGYKRNLALGEAAF